MFFFFCLWLSLFLLFIIFSLSFFFSQVFWAKCASSLTILLSVCTLNSLFLCVLIVKSSVFIQFKTKISAIVSLAALRVLCSRVTLGKSRVWWQTRNISCSTYETCSMFSDAGGIWLEKKHVWIKILALGQVSLSVWLADILSKTVEGLYGISPVVCHADCIIRVVISCCRDFCIKEKKLALSMLYVVNLIFSVSNIW